MGHLDRPGSSAHPFNSLLETGIRALFVLEAFYPRRCDLLEMTLLDHLVVHTGDLGDEDAPQSLHPDLPNRAGELVVRRQLVEKSLRMMQEVHLIDVFETEEGVTFVASEDAPSYLDLLQAPYSLGLKDRAQWIAHRFADMTAAEIREQMQNRIGRWTADFRFEEKFDGARP
jgi:ATP-dependent DNA ligase